ncbi:hypothetical protein AB9E48_00670 [Escherichia coli]|uniref:hypothetical protein n=1 Tax=Escherichia coli TaxID=562 RepID=UPI0038B5A67F
MVCDGSVRRHHLHGMSGNDVDDICGADVVSVRNRKQKILLTGTCGYELTGLWSLLSVHGYDVYCALPGQTCPVANPDLIIVALSAEPVAGWGRHLPRIRELRRQLSGEMLVLVPEKLKMLTVLQDICAVYSGCNSLQKLKAKIRAALAGKPLQGGRFILTDGQRRALKRLSGGGDSPLPVKNGEREWYYHHARLAENVGVRDFRLLLMTGLERELSKMEGIQNAGTYCDNGQVAAGDECRGV